MLSPLASLPLSCSFTMWWSTKGFVHLRSKITYCSGERKEQLKHTGTLQAKVRYERHDPRKCYSKAYTDSQLCIKSKGIFASVLRTVVQCKLKICCEPNWGMGLGHLPRRKVRIPASLRVSLIRLLRLVAPSLHTQFWNELLSGMEFDARTNVGNVSA